MPTTPVMNDMTAALTILSAMITPAVLISAVGSLILTTSQRLSRVIDRTRRVADQFQMLANPGTDGPPREDVRAELFDQLGWVTRRSRLLQRALTSLYLALSVFVATSVAIGLVAIGGQRYAWVPISLGIFGTALLLFSSLLLIAESRLAVQSVEHEMDFVLRSSRQHATAEMLERSGERQRVFRWYRH